jgi:two-component system, OmpR family, catabolic regulation response regulator CreB
MKQRILIVEDENSIADNICFALKKEGLDVEWHDTIHKATQAFNEIKYDLILLDINLPDGNGFDFCREIRTQSNIPIIFLSSRSDEIDRVVGLEMGADDYVIKPFSPRELSARVKSVLRRTNQDNSPAKEQLIFKGDFKIDHLKHQIVYKETSLELSRYEYKILLALLEHPGWVLTRAQLMEKVWDEPGISFDRTIDTHIKTIRNKLRKVCIDSNPIQTHRGTGYSLNINH